MPKLNNTGNDKGKQGTRKLADTSAGTRHNLPRTIRRLGEEK